MIGCLKWLQDFFLTALVNAWLADFQWESAGPDGQEDERLTAPRRESVSRTRWCRSLARLGLGDVVDLVYLFVLYYRQIF